MPPSDPLAPEGGPARGGRAVPLLRPDLPPLEDLLPDLQAIWDSGVLSNGGACHQRFEAALSARLGGAHVSLFANATLGLLLTLKALGLQGEVITTPFTFVATANALRWAGLTPVFADIDADTLNLSVAAVAAAITPRTVALLPVHCYGQPCDMDGLEGLAARHGLQVVYDAAHAFDVRQRGRSVLTRGRASVVSFHATKVMNTFEGGAVVTHDLALKQHLDRLANHGLDPTGVALEAGLNAKMNELSAALGCLQLERVAQAITRRAAVDAAYRRGLADVEGLRCLPLQAGVSPNHAYFPLLVEETYGIGRDELCERLQAQGIQTRRYFYPLASDMPVFADLPQRALPVARRRAQQVLCLPMHPALDTAQQQRTLAVLATAGRR